MEDAFETGKSMELPAVIIGERGDDERPGVRVLPGRVPEHRVLHPAYLAVGAAAVLALYFSLNTGEWHPMMVGLGWGLLFCWYWVYGVGWRYRRRVMKYFALLMSTATALTLTFVTTARIGSMTVPEAGELIPRDGQPLLGVVAVLTMTSLIAVLAHAVYLGRGYRQKRVNHDNGDSA